MSEPGHLDVIEGRGEVSHADPFPPALKNTQWTMQRLGGNQEKHLPKGTPGSQMSSFCESTGLFTEFHLAFTYLLRNLTSPHRASRSDFTSLSEVAPLGKTF